jgi:NifU-like protein involved in Fe-S cluster formation
MGNNEESIILDASGRAAMVQSTVKNQTRDEADLARQNLDKMFEAAGGSQATIPDAPQIASPATSF